MKVSEALASRRSIRAFLDRPVPGEVLRTVLATAARAPSGGNLQPWRLYVLGGPDLAALKARMEERLPAWPETDPPEYAVYPERLGEPYRTRRFRVGEQMYALLGIPRDDRAGRQRCFINNFRFFGAPAALFCYVDRGMGAPQWSDLGMYLQSVMLLLREHGLDSCPQECWSRFPLTLAEFLSTPPELMLFCGMAIGYRDPDAAVNDLVSERAPLEEFAEFRGI